MSAEKLYTPQMLSAAMELANWPLLENGSHHGEARSSTCGSTIAMNFTLAADGLIENIGMRVRACAIGQASSAIFARHALGRELTELASLHQHMEQWIVGKASRPEWPDLELIETARGFSARHGAMLLPWSAAQTALSSSLRAG